MGAKLNNVLFQNQLPPIGTILAWAKGATGVPALPGTWAECDGTTVNGITTPDLTSNAWLFGSTTYSATPNTNIAPTHTHTIARYTDGGSDGIICNAGGSSTATSGKIGNPTGGSSIQVVYIMRVA